jgi:hypothetical protein
MARMVSYARARFVSPISSPGPRLLLGVPLRAIRAGLRRRGRALGFELPLVSFIDCLLCLVLFLLASFGSEVDCPERLRVPGADNTVPGVEAPLVTVTERRILVDGAPAGNASLLLEGGRLARVDELFQMLKSKRELWRELNPGREFPGEVVLQVDRRVPALVVKSAFQTAAFAGYPNVSFLVQRR